MFIVTSFFHKIIVVIFMYKVETLKYDYKDLEPYYNKEMFYNHYFNLYQGYADSLNKIFDKLTNARKNSDYSDIKQLKKDLGFTANAYILHGLFFLNLTPMPNKTHLSEKLINHIKKDFESYDAFIDELNYTLENIQGPGWVVFGYSISLKKLLIIQIEVHQVLNLIDFIPLLVIDMWEHSYYLQYKTNKKEYIRNLFYILDFDVVSERYNKIYLI